MRKKLSLRSQRFKLEKAQEAAKKVIERLHQLNYINDEKILENYLEYNLEAKPQGKFAFLQSMRRRGICPDAASSAWLKRKIDERSLAEKLIEKKRNQFAKFPVQKRKEKIIRLLASRGFAGDILWDTLDKIK